MSIYEIHAQSIKAIADAIYERRSFCWFGSPEKQARSFRYVESALSARYL